MKGLTVFIKEIQVRLHETEVYKHGWMNFVYTGVKIFFHSLISYISPVQMWWFHNDGQLSSTTPLSQPPHEKKRQRKYENILEYAVNSFIEI